MGSVALIHQAKEQLDSKNFQTKEFDIYFLLVTM